MKPLRFWKTIVADRSDFLERLLAVLSARKIRYCVVGGQAVNAYVEPLVSLDLDLAVSADQIDDIETALEAAFRVERFPHSINISTPDSGLRAQIQTDPRYAAFVGRASIRDVLGMQMPVASVEDVMQGKVWAAQDPTRRASKRQKDFADIARLLEAFPALRPSVPAEILARLV
jgi:hypothetical protein